MPIFAITEGKIYRVGGIDQETGRVVKGELVTREEILQQPFELSEEQKEKIRGELLLDSPFICESPEALYIRMKAEGQGMYVELNTKIILNRAQQHGESEIAQTFSETDRIKYFIENGALVKERTAKHQKERSYREQIDPNTSHFLPFHTEGGKFSVEEQAIENNEDYISAMERTLPQLREEDKPEKLNRFAFHLYGFAEEARRFGDNETAQRAEVLANQVLSGEQYSEVVGRRIDAQGRFRITREELEGESKSHVV